MALEAKKLSYFARGHKGKTELVVTHYVSVTHHRVSFPSLVANTTRIVERLAHFERLSLCLCFSFSPQNIFSLSVIIPKPSSH